jgi:TetR/AcrR family transcriptional repressor of mexJK operon
MIRRGRSNIKRNSHNQIKARSGTLRRPRIRKLDIILKAARKVFLENGYGAASTDMIRAAADVSRSTLYSHFPSKRELFETVCRKTSDDFEETLRLAVGDERRPREYLTRFGIAYLRYLLARDSLLFYGLMIDSSRHFPKLGRVFYHAGVKVAEDMIVAYLRDADQAGWLHVRYPMTAAEHVLGMLRGEMHMRAVLNVGPIPSAAKQRAHVNITVGDFFAAHGPVRNP